MTRDLERTSARCKHSFFFGAGSLALLAYLAVSGAALSQDRRVPDTYTATTTGMTPDGQGLRFVVMDWSDDGARSAVVSVLSVESAETAAETGETGESGESDESVESGEPVESVESGASEALSELPSVGALWVDGSGAGYSVKYAHRVATDDGGELVTLVTDKAVGSYNFTPWTADSTTATTTVDYSVVELRLDGAGNGIGTMSLAADVKIDEESNIVSLDIAAETPSILADVALEPKPYWAQGG